MKTSLFLLAMSFSFCAFAQNQKTQNTFDEQTVRQKMKEDGLTEMMIDKLLQQRKELKNTGRDVNWTSIKKYNLDMDTATSCYMGVENGWGNWQWQNGTNSGANPPTWVGTPTVNPTSSPLGPGGNFYSITSGAGNDRNGNFPFVCPGFGNHSIMIGDSCGVNSNCNKLIYPLTVTAQDTNFLFAYAAVVEDAGHLPTEQPFVSFYIYDQNANQISGFTDTGGVSMANYLPVTGNGCAISGTDHYKPWTKDSINLSAYIGQTVNIVITNADCVYGGHFAYAYFDFICSSNEANVNEIINSSVIISPNPSSGNIFIDFGNKDFGKAEIIFSDVIGQTLLKKSITASGKQMLDISNFSKGIYFLNLKTESGTATKKIVITK